jgi:Ni/Co efflux regulator RcnB
MRKFVTAAMTSVLALSALGAAGPVSAQDRGRDRDRVEQRQDRREDRQERREDRREWREDHREHREDRRERWEDRAERREDRREWRDDRRDYRHDRREWAQHQREYARWRQAQRRFDVGPWYAPRGYAYRPYGYGHVLPPVYRSRTYVIVQPQRYYLEPPPYGYAWHRYGNDAVLVSLASGLIAAVVGGLFY